MSIRRRMRAGRRAVVVTSAAACVAASVVVAGSSPGTAKPQGPPFVALGPAASFGHGRSLCPGEACYTPQQLQQAYDFPTGRNAPTGRGQTIVLVVAYGNPSLESDVAQFDSLFNIQPTTIRYCGANGVNQDDEDAPAWGPETSADVEYAHAMAPNARIVLAVAPTDDDQDIADTAAACLPQYPGAIVSQSFGEDEDLIAESALNTFHAAYDAATAAGGTIVAGAGDYGATDGDDYAIAAYPASDPLVTAVGGTMGKPYPGGLLRGNSGYGDEQVWNEPDLFPFGVGTGGAPSVLFDDPSYQAPFNSGHSNPDGMRTVADVAYNASINGGELVVFGGDLGNFGGTSVGPPHWAAIFALANELRSSAHQDSLGQANPALYAIATDRHRYANDFHDITRGDNAVDSDIGFRADDGYDIPTGLGTPDVANLLRDLSGSSSHHHDGGDHGHHHVQRHGGRGRSHMQPGA